MRADQDSIQEGLRLLDRFISGEDRTNSYVSRLGVFFDEKISDSEVIDDLVIAAASYESQGGELLFDEKSFLDLCMSARRILEKHADTRTS